MVLKAKKNLIKFVFVVFRCSVAILGNDIGAARWKNFENCCIATHILDTQMSNAFGQTSKQSVSIQIIQFMFIYNLIIRVYFTSETKEFSFFGIYF